MPNRGAIEVEIYGMEGIPEKDMEEKRRQNRSKRDGKFQKLNLNLTFLPDFCVCKMQRCLFGFLVLIIVLL